MAHLVSRGRCVTNQGVEALNCCLCLFCWELLEICDCCLLCESSQRPQADERPHYTEKVVDTHAGRCACFSSPSPRSHSLTAECDNCEDQGKGDCSSLGSVTCSCSSRSYHGYKDLKIGE